MFRLLSSAVLLALVFSGCATSQQKNAASSSEMSGESTDNSAQTGALSSEQMEEIQRIVRNGLSGVNACYQQEMERQNNQKLAGKVMVKIIIDTTGRARDVQITEATITAPMFQQCIKSTIKTWEFPRIAKETEFAYPFEFSPAY